MEFAQIIYEKLNRVATITLNRPKKLNAYSEIGARDSRRARRCSRR